jgi:hypothetical protein
MDVGISTRKSRALVRRIRGRSQMIDRSRANVKPLTLVCSTTEAAAILDLTEERVLQFVRSGRIEGRQLKREWVLSLASVKAFKRRPRKQGRPKAN